MRVLAPSLTVALLSACWGGDASRPSVSLDAAAAPPAVWDPCKNLDPTPWPWRSEAEGMWGEDPHLRSAAEYRQERRAPKLPDAGKYLAKLESQTVTTLEHALLICHVETYSRNGGPVWYRYKLDPPPSDRPRCAADWDALAGPDALLRFRFRADYPITLFGPEDHFGFFISIPNVSLAVGDPIAIKIWDRDSGTSTMGSFNQATDDYMGEVRGTFDGALPIVLRAPFFMLRCNATTSAEAWAVGALATLDRTLNTASKWQPDRNQFHFGENRSLVSFSSDARNAAGFVGWDHPVIQRQLARAEAIAVEDQQKRRALAEKLGTTAPRLTTTTRLLPGVVVTRIDCTTTPCAVELAVDRALVGELAGALLFPKIALAAIATDGTFSSLSARVGVGAAWELYEPTRLPPGTESVRLRDELNSTSLLWFRNGDTTQVFRLH